ncbi:MAG: sigma 54-interacting transcriptional regulator [Desulfovibrio sp.]|nr:sigma 54-interacting transcriptional regulator [Desulfovibrio sp.]
MYPCDIARKSYFREWQRFVDTGECDATVIRPVILESWKRCRAQNLNPYMSASDCCITDQDHLDALLRSNAALISLAKPYLDILGKVVDETHFIGLLASRQGHVLHAVGDPDLLESADKGFIRPGAVRNEHHAGTTGIALSLISKQPVQIFSAEHYCAFYHDWTCSSAPICDDSGELIGVLNLSGDYRLIHKHTLGIVIAMAKALEQALGLRSTNTYLQNCIDSSEYGLAVLDNKQNVKQINKILAQYTSSPSDKLLGQPVTEVLFSSPPLTKLLDKDNRLFEKSISIKKNDKYNTLLVNTQAVYNEENEPIGKLIITKEKKDIHRLVHRMVGAYATFTFEDILGNNERIRRAVELAGSVAPTNARVLIQGESGTGKELFAQAIHNASDLRDGPFIGINCSAIPSELMESEFFGYNEGAFSGAKKGGMPGKFELADGGTIFLDEIDSMPQEMQIKLLRVLEENKITRVGGNTVMPVNVRILAASSKNVGDLVKQGLIRLDLYYRINTIILDIPPLRERTGDIPLLARHIADMVCRKLGQGKKELSQDFLAALMHHEWPGNVRELGNILERSILIARDAPVLTTGHLDTICFQMGKSASCFSASASASQPEAEPGAGLSGIRPLKNIEQEAIAEALRLTGNNHVLAASLLGIHRNTLRNKLKEYSN